MRTLTKFMGGTGLAALALLSAGEALAQSASRPSPPPAAAKPKPPKVPTNTTKPLRPLSQQVDPFYRNVRAFWGEVNPFYRNVRAFWGDVDPFYGNVRAFWGDIDPVAAAAKAGAPAYDKIGAFWETVGARWDLIGERWQVAGEYRPESAEDYQWISANLGALVDETRAFWAASVTKKTRAKSFEQGFMDPFLARYGVSLNDPASLARMDAATQSRFFVEFYDGLMEFSGTDHADWWMRTINWTPALTQTMGAGAGSTLGLVDDYGAKSIDLIAKV